MDPQLRINGHTRDSIVQKKKNENTLSRLSKGTTVGSWNIATILLRPATEGTTPFFDGTNVVLVGNKSVDSTTRASGTVAVLMVFIFSRLLFVFYRKLRHSARPAKQQRTFKDFFRVTSDTDRQSATVEVGRRSVRRSSEVGPRTHLFIYVFSSRAPRRCRAEGFLDFTTAGVK